jgi:hypothetical protein
MTASPPPARRSVLLAIPALLAGCNQPQVQVDQAYNGPRLPRPARIYLRDFAVTPSDVTLDSGVRGRVTQMVQDPGDTQLAVARTTAAALSSALADSLASSGIPVIRIGRADVPAGGSVVIDGQLLAVDEGNRTQRRLIGFGRGQSSMEADAKLYLIDGSAAPRLLESATGAANRGHAPGLAGGRGAGRAVGRISGAAASGATGIGAGIAGAVEGAQADDTAEAGRIGKAIGGQFQKFFASQGWTR